jgi:predicted DNA-binding transcriptional regulator YafY
VYYIEAAAWGRSNYLIAYCPDKKTICTFKTDLIIGEVSIEDITYEIPPGFDANEIFDSAWGIYVDEDLMSVKLRFSPKVSQVVAQTAWHPSQKTELQKDGFIIMYVKIRNTVDFRGWVLGWGENVEVLEPESLRKQVIKISDLVRKIYRAKKAES